MTTHATPSIQQLFDLSGLAAWSPGATGHLGRALAEAGCRVVVASRDGDKARRCAGQLDGKEAGRHLGVMIDHMDADSIKRGFAAAVEQAGRIDVLVNNGNEHVKSDLTNCTGEEFNRQLANASGYFLLTRGCATRRLPGGPRPA